MREIFCFGSNERGIHSAGAALTALREHGAIYGQGEGLQGDSYAIPTKDEYLRPLLLVSIELYVEEFLEFARAHPEMRFNVTRIGTGLAGYSDADIAPMFADCPPNVVLPKAWGGNGYDW